MRVAMIGTGYVGLVSGACFSEFGVNVTCVDKDTGKIERLLRGEMPIYEPGLDQLVASNMAAGRLRFTSDLKAAVAGADAVFIAVGTPSRRGDGHADLSYVFAAAAEIAEALQQNGNERTVVVTKSTVPVGTGRRVDRILKKALPPNSSLPAVRKQRLKIRRICAPEPCKIFQSNRFARHPVHRSSAVRAGRRRTPGLRGFVRAHPLFVEPAAACGARHRPAILSSSNR